MNQKLVSFLKNQKRDYAPHNVPSNHFPYNFSSLFSSLNSQNPSEKFGRNFKQGHEKDTNLGLERVINNSIVNLDFLFFHATESFNSALFVRVQEFLIVFAVALWCVIIIETVVGRFEVWRRLTLRVIV